MKEFFLYAMALFYIGAGSYHFIRPKFYRRIMPPWLIWHMPLIYISGAFEIILGILLIPEATRNSAAWGLVILLILIFPANIQMMLNFKRKRSPYLWITVLRLPLQIVVIWWALKYT
ncbi:MAG: DoxX family protein [Bacteroidota bacterium]